MNNTIYYVGFYDIANANHSRNYVLSATTKMDYIASSIVRGGYKVEILSCSWINDKDWKFVKGENQQINEYIKLTTMPSFGVKTKFGKVLRVYFTLFAIFFRLLFINKNETVLVYHTPWLSLPVRIAKKIKGFRMILEIEEVYTYAFSLCNKTLTKELSLIKSADSWILVNDLIGDLLGLDRLKSIICYGVYKIDNKPLISSFSKNDKVHLVYAGTLGEYNGGVQNAIQAARFLSDKYILHILGAIEGESLLKLLKDIDDVNTFSKCKVKYEGCKTGDEFISFMNGCDIGLNPQNWGDYMLYAYPSKTLSYFCFGLNVVTSPLKTLKVSQLDSYFNYFNQENPQSIANAITNIKLFPKSVILNKIEELDDAFVNNIKKILHD